MPLKRKHTYLILSVLYSLFLYWIYTRNGIITLNEAEKYILAAQALSTGNIEYTFQHHLFYSSYILFIAVFSQFGGIPTVVAAQACFTFISAICLGKTIQLLTKKGNAATIGMLLFLFSYPIQIWTLTLFSDIFFISLIPITLFYTVKDKSKNEVFIWGFLMLLLVFARPPGVFLSTAFFVYFLSQTRLLNKPQLILISSALFLLLFVALFYLPVGTKDYIKPIAAGAIIVDQPDYHIPQFNSIEKSNLFSAYKYLNNQGGGQYIAKLYFKKLISFFTLTRPYYSKWHNIIMLLHYPLYIFSILGLILLTNKQQRYLFLCSLFLLANLTAITYNEWHYRFTLTTFPFLIILSSASLTHYFNLVFNRAKKYPRG